MPDDVSSRIALLKYTWARREPELRKAHQASVFWMIETQPRNAILSRAEGGLSAVYDGRAVNQAAALWRKQVAANPKDPVILANAAEFLGSPRTFDGVSGDGEAEALALLTRCRQLEPQSAVWPEKLAALYHLKMNGADSDVDRKRYALQSVKNFEQALALNHDDIDTIYLLPELAKTCFEAGEYGKARDYATRLRAYANPEAIHDSNLVLGRLALRAGDLAAARRHLLEAGTTPGAPSLNSFGPNMTLAKELLERGQAETVLEYFNRCGTFWRGDRGKLKEWSKLVRAGKIPDFGASLIH
jgi:hypothetical protein